MNISHAATGFTLIEVLMALLILTMGVMGFATLQGRNATGNAKSQTISLATMLAHAELENMINTPYDACEDYNASVVINNKAYNITCIVNENATASYKDVQITVSVDGMNSSFSYIKTTNYE